MGWDWRAIPASIGESLYERAVIQKHPITFATVDLSGPAVAIRNELRVDTARHTTSGAKPRQGGRAKRGTSPRITAIGMLALHLPLYLPLYHFVLSSFMWVLIALYQRFAKTA
jgi:hypothetical protein